MTHFQIFRKLITLSVESEISQYMIFLKTILILILEGTARFAELILKIHPFSKIAVTLEPVMQF